MRILGEINDLPVKVTALTMNNRISIKYEDGDNEITLKFRDGSIITDMASVTSYVRQSGHIESILELFATVSKTRSKGVQGLVDQSGADLPEII